MYWLYIISRESVVISDNLSSSDSVGISDSGRDLYIVFDSWEAIIETIKTVYTVYTVY